MIESPQKIQVGRAGVVQNAKVAWWWSEDNRWTVSIESAAFDPIEVRADDAFEALCIVRDQLEPHGWRLGVAGAQVDVWPSGMARDQGGGQRAYRLTTERVGDVVDVFEPVDPATVTTVAAQRAAADRFYEEIRRAGS